MYGLAKIADSSYSDYTLDPEWQKLQDEVNRTEAQETAIRSRFGEEGPDYLSKGDKAFRNTMGAGSAAGLLLGGAAGASPFWARIKETKSIPGKVGLGLAGLGTGALTALPSAMVGGVTTAAAIGSPINSLYVRKQEKATPELMKEYREAQNDSRKAINNLENYDYGDNIL